MTSKVEEIVKKIVSERFDTALNNILNTHRFVEDLGVDSLGKVELIIQLEEAFIDYKIEISDEMAAKIQTVQDAINCIEGAISESENNN